MFSSAFYDGGEFEALQREMDMSCRTASAAESAKEDGGNLAEDDFPCGYEPPNEIADDEYRPRHGF